MAHFLGGIDHVILRSADPIAAAAAWRQLGFAVTEGHDAAGDAQNLVLLPGAHLTLAGGASGDAVGLICTGMEAARVSLGEAGFAPGPVARSVETAGLGERTAELPARFSWLPQDSLPGVAYLLCERESDPRGPDLVLHPNGVETIFSLTLVIDRPESQMTDFNRLFGPAASTPTDDMVTVHTGRGLIYLVSPDRFDDLHPSLDLAVDGMPSLRVVTFGVADLARTERAIAGQGVHVLRRGDHLGVHLPALAGLGVEFVEV